MTASDYYCLADDGRIWKLGNHGDIEAADDTAASLGLNAIWIIDEKAADQWRAALAAPDLLAALRAVIPYAENEAYSLQELADSEVAEAQAEAAWQAVETAQAAIERAT